MNADIATAVATLRKGGLVALPTETVYGLAADARNATAVRKIFDAKGRPADHPLIVHLAAASAMDEWASDIPVVARELAKALWPGPMTLVLRRHGSVLDDVTGGWDTVALRVPDHPVALAVLTHFGGGLAAPSANRYGKVSPTSAVHVRDELGTAVDYVLDGGSCRVGIESTIVDVSDGRPRILRPGLVTAQDIERVIGHPLADAPGPRTPSPGLKPSHYAPRATVRIADADHAASEVLRWQKRHVRVGLMATKRPDGCPTDIPWLPLDEDLRVQARRLYARLRDVDECGLDVVVIVPPSGPGLARALRDRLYRSAGQGDHIDDAESP